MRRSSVILILVVAGLIALALGIFVGRKMASAEPKKSSPAKANNPTQGRCASQRTYDRIKGELFRRAAVTRGSDHSAFDRLSAYSVVRVERPLLADFDEQLGTIRCTGRLSLDLPPGVSVVGNRRTLSADIDYVLQPAADRTGDVVILEGADPIVIPLATLVRTADQSQLPEINPPLGPPDRQVSGATSSSPQETVVPSPPVAQPVEPAPSAPPATSQAPVSRPSFNCRYARTWGEIAVCRNGQLAALDRQMASEYYRALSRADARERRLLTSSRDDFLRSRDQCRSQGCVAQRYEERMADIRAIMRSGR